MAGTWSLWGKIERGRVFCLPEGISQGFANASFVNKPWSAWKVLLSHLELCQPGEVSVKAKFGWGDN